MWSSDASPLWHFDVRRFGREVRLHRETLGLSTRELARLARLSQSYVVALERSTSSRDASGPAPTVTAVVALATALRVHPADLLGTALLQAGPHVLYVVDGDGRGIFDTARRRLGAIDVWLSAGARQDAREDGAPATPHINIHSPGDLTYRRDRVSATIHQELLDLRSVVARQRVGIVFSDVDTALLGATSDLLAMEHEWQTLVSSAGWSSEAESVTAVCVYELDVLMRMDSPLPTTLELFDSHEEVWFSDEHQTCAGRTASMRVLQRLRPSRTRASEWRETCARHLDRRSLTFHP